MAKPIELPTRGHFVNGNGWLGSAGPLRFQIETPVQLPCDPPDKDPEDRDYIADVVCWQGPFSRPYAPELDRQTFPITLVGLEDIKAYLNEKAAKLEENPAFSEEELFRLYQERKAEEDAKQPE